MPNQTSTANPSTLWLIYTAKSAAETKQQIAQLEQEQPHHELLPMLIIFRNSHQKGVLDDYDLQHKTKAYLEEHRISREASQLVESVKQRIRSTPNR